MDTTPSFSTCFFSLRQEVLMESKPHRCRLWSQDEEMKGVLTSPPSSRSLFPSNSLSSPLITPSISPLRQDISIISHPKISLQPRPSSDRAGKSFYRESSSSFWRQWFRKASIKTENRQPGSVAENRVKAKFRGNVIAHKVTAMVQTDTNSHNVAPCNRNGGKNE